jgi:hypothetical protein
MIKNDKKIVPPHVSSPAAGPPKGIDGIRAASRDV